MPLTALLLASIASTQASSPTTTAPFLGAQRESFEGISVHDFECLPIFQGAAEVCELGEIGGVITAGVGGMCTTGALSGELLALGHFDGLRVTFDGLATRLGGYFTSTQPAAELTASFYDADGALLGVLVYAMPQLCEWAWFVAVASAGHPFHAVDLTLTGETSAIQASLLVDLLQADVTGSVVHPPPTTYCTAKTTSGGCVPTLSTNYTGIEPDVPKVGFSSGFRIDASQLEPMRTGMFFYGASGARATPFSCTGFLCVEPPVQRIAPESTAGFAPCGGALSLEWNGWTKRDAADLAIGAPFAPGQHLWAQAWFRDPSACGSSGLTDAVEFVMH